MILFDKIKSTFYLATLFAAVLTLGACNQKDPIGPELVPASSNFKILSSFSVDATSIDFVNNANPLLGFTSKFNERVSWEVELKGLSSGAVKVFKGIGTEFDSKTVSWDGRSDVLPFFFSNEYVKASLKVLGADSIYVIDSLKTEGSYTYHTRVVNGVKHIVIDDFEKFGSRYSPVSLTGLPDAADSQTSFVGTDKMLMQGTYGYQMHGKDDNKNSWCGGTNSENLIDFYLVGNTSGLLIDSGINPNDLYFNLFIYGTGKANTSVQLKVYELDAKSYVNGDGDSVKINNREDMRNYVYNGSTIPPGVNKYAKYDQGKNDGYIYDIEVTWTGWKLVSAPYAKFKPANDFLMGGNGDRVKESWRVAGMAISLLSQPGTGSYVETYIDYLVVTQGGKFQQ